MQTKSLKSKKVKMRGVVQRLLKVKPTPDERTKALTEAFKRRTER